MATGARVDAGKRLARADQARVIHGLSHLRDRRLNEPLILENGAGVYIFDHQGQRYLDAVSGIYCTSLGLGNESLIGAATDQMRQLAYFPSISNQTHPPLALLSDLLGRLSPMPRTRVYMGITGSDSVDTLVKFLWLRNNGRGLSQKKHIIVREGDYHGSTIASASLTATSGGRACFDLPILSTSSVSQPDLYRGLREGESPQEFSERLVAELRREILRIGPENVAAFFIEPVSSASGVIIPPAGYLSGVASLCRDFDVALCVDEVVTGIGRTGHMFASELFGLQPDAIVLGKGLSSAYVPTAALLLDGRFYDGLELAAEQFGILAHGQTFSGHPVSCAVSLATLRYILDNDVLGHVGRMADVFQRRIEALRESPLVGDVRCVGLMGGVEIVADKKTKEPFDPDLRVAAAIQSECKRRGLLVRVVLAGSAITLLPALIVTESQIEEIFDVLQSALGAVSDAMGQS